MAEEKTPKDPQDTAPEKGARRRSRPTFEDFKKLLPPDKVWQYDPSQPLYNQFRGSPDPNEIVGPPAPPVRRPLTPMVVDPDRHTKMKTSDWTKPDGYNQPGYKPKGPDYPLPGQHEHYNTDPAAPPSYRPKPKTPEQRHVDAEQQRLNDDFNYRYNEAVKDRSVRAEQFLNKSVDKLDTLIANVKHKNPDKGGEWSEVFERYKKVYELKVKHEIADAHAEKRPASVDRVEQMITAEWNGREKLLLTPEQQKAMDELLKERNRDRFGPSVVESYWKNVYDPDKGGIQWGGVAGAIGLGFIGFSLGNMFGGLLGGVIAALALSAAGGTLGNAASSWIFGDGKHIPPANTPDSGVKIVQGDFLKKEFGKSFPYMSTAMKEEVNKAVKDTDRVAMQKLSDDRALLVVIDAKDKAGAKEYTLRQAIIMDKSGKQEMFDLNHAIVPEIKDDGQLKTYIDTQLNKPNQTIERTLEGLGGKKIAAAMPAIPRGTVRGIDTQQGEQVEIQPTMVSNVVTQKLQDEKLARPDTGASVVPS